MLLTEDKQLNKKIITENQHIVCSNCNHSYKQNATYGTFTCPKCGVSKSVIL